MLQVFLNERKLSLSPRLFWICSPDAHNLNKGKLMKILNPFALHNFFHEEML